MSSVHHTLEIERSPAAVYERLTDVARIQEWAPLVVASSCLEGDRRVGTPFVVKADLKPVGGPKFEFHNVIAEMIPGKKVVWRQTDGPLKRLEWVFELEPSAERTRLKLCLDYQMPYSILGRLIDWVKMNRVIASSCRVNLEGLKRTLEAPS